MRDSLVATRYDHNPVISLRLYRRGDHVAPPKLVVSRCRAYNRLVTLSSLIICKVIVVLLPQTLQVLVVLLPRTLQVLVVLLPCTLQVLVLLVPHTL
jgi:hypothetical protein